MSSTRSLWPADLKASDRLMPADILRQQASDLASKTNGLLRGMVELGSQGDWLTNTFYVLAPRLDDYIYRLFKVRHKLPDPFKPLEIIVGSKDIRKVSSSEEYERALADIFGAEGTRSLLGELISLSEKASPDVSESGSEKS